MHLFNIPQCPTQNRDVHFYSEWSIVGYRTGAFWDMWNWSLMIKFKLHAYFMACLRRPFPTSLSSVRAIAWPSPAATILTLAGNPLTRPKVFCDVVPFRPNWPWLLSPAERNSPSEKKIMGYINPCCAGVGVTKHFYNFSTQGWSR